MVGVEVAPSFVVAFVVVVVVATKMSSNTHLIMNSMVMMVQVED